LEEVNYGQKKCQVGTQQGASLPSQYS